MTRPWDYLTSEQRLAMIEAAKDAVRSIGGTVHDGHHPLCSNYMQPAKNCWQCFIIAERATDDSPDAHG